jgi:hypothetical protein
MTAKTTHPAASANGRERIKSAAAFDAH